MANSALPVPPTDITPAENNIIFGLNPINIDRICILQALKQRNNRYRFNPFVLVENTAGKVVLRFYPNVSRAGLEITATNTESPPMFPTYNTFTEADYQALQATNLPNAEDQAHATFTFQSEGLIVDTTGLSLDQEQQSLQEGLQLATQTRLLQDPATTNVTLDLKNIPEKPFALAQAIILFLDTQEAQAVNHISFTNTDTNSHIKKLLNHLVAMTENDNVLRMRVQTLLANPNGGETALSQKFKDLCKAAKEEANSKNPHRARTQSAHSGSGDPDVPSKQPPASAPLASPQAQQPKPTAPLNTENLENPNNFMGTPNPAQAPQTFLQNAGFSDPSSSNQSTPD